MITDYAVPAKEARAKEVSSPYLRRKQAAEYLCVSESLLSKFAVIGGGPPYSLAGRLAVYSRADLDQWMLSKRRASSSAA